MTEQYGPQYQPPPQPQQWIHQQVPPPPPPEPPKKKSTKGRNVLIAVAVLVGIVVAVNIPDGDTKTATPPVAQVAPVTSPEPSEPAVEEEPSTAPDADGDSSMESEKGYLTYKEIKSAFESSGFDVVVFHSSKKEGGCFDGAGSSDATIAFVVFKCQYNAMPVVLPEFEDSIADNTDIQYKVRDANWVVYFSQELDAYQFAGGYPGAEVEVI